MVFESDSSCAGYTCRHEQRLQLKCTGGEYKDIARAESVRRLCFGDAVKREVTRPPLKSIDLDHLGAIALGWECEMLYIAVLLCSTSPANMDIMNAILQSAVTVLCDHTGTGHFRTQDARVFSTVLSSL